MTYLLEILIAYSLISKHFIETANEIGTGGNCLERNRKGNDQGCFAFSTYALIQILKLFFHGVIVFFTSGKFEKFCA